MMLDINMKIFFSHVLIAIVAGFVGVMSHYLGLWQLLALSVLSGLSLALIFKFILYRSEK